MSTLVIDPFETVRLELRVLVRVVVLLLLHRCIDLTPQRREVTRLALVISPIVRLLLTLWVLRLYLTLPVLLRTLVLLPRHLGCCCCCIDAST